MNLPILSVPEELETLCKPYESLFSKPQFLQFERFITALTVSNEANIEALSEGYRMSQSYDRLHHFVTESPWDVNDVLERNVSVIKELPTDRSFSEEGYLLIDDTLIEKFGEHMEAVGKLYDHAESRYLEYAHCLLGLIYANHKQLRYPLKFELYRKEEDCTKEGLPFKTKITCAKEMISWAVEQGIPFQTILFDSWFFTQELVDHIESLGKDWISMSKSDRIMTHEGRHASLRDYAETLDPHHMPKVKVGEKTYHQKSLQTSFKCLKRNLERIRLVVSYEKKEDGSFKTPVFLVSNRKDIRPERLIRAYQIRWSIETFFRDSKSELGLGEYQVRGLKGIKSHWCLVFTSAVLLELVRSKECSEKGLVRADLSVGSLRQRAWGRSLRSVIEWCVKQHEQGMQATELCAILKV